MTEKIYSFYALVIRAARKWQKLSRENIFQTQTFFPLASKNTESTQICSK